MIGCVANFNPCKRQIDLIKAIEIVRRTVPDVKLKLLGMGLTRAACETYVDEHDLRTVVEFIEPVPHDQLPGFYRSLDLFVMPSVNEGFCCVNVEANACGVPFMAVKGLPMDEVLVGRDQSRWLFEANNVEDMAAHIVGQAQCPQEQNLMIDLGANRLAAEFVDWIQGRNQ